MNYRDDRDCGKLHSTTSQYVFNNIYEKVPKINACEQSL